MPVAINIPVDYMTVEEAENVLYDGTFYEASSVRGIIDRVVNNQEE